MRRIFLLIFVMSSLLLSACTVKIAYNQLDWMVPWYINDFVEFEGGQTQLFETEFAEYLDWHREDALPKYAAFLDDLSKLFSVHWDNESGQFSMIPESTYLEIEHRLNGLLDMTLQPLIAPTLALSQSMTVEQITQLKQGFTESNQKFYEPYLEHSESELREQRADKVIKFLERFLDELTPQQLKHVANWQQRHLLMQDVMLMTRIHWQSEFVKAIADASSENKQVLRDKFNHLFTKRVEYRAKEHRVFYETNKMFFIELFDAVFSEMSAEQYQHLQNVLQDYREDLLELAQINNK